MSQRSRLEAALHAFVDEILKVVEEEAESRKSTTSRPRAPRIPQRPDVQVDELARAKAQSVLRRKGYQRAS